MYYDGRRNASDCVTAYDVVGLKIGPAEGELLARAEKKDLLCAWKKVGRRVLYCCTCERDKYFERYLKIRVAIHYVHEEGFLNDFTVSN